MTRSELATVIILRVIGVSGLFAIPTIFLPYLWMNAINDYVGLGEMPNTPIVSYLARSLSAFYAMVSAITLLISSDIRRYRPFVKLWAIIAIITGFVLLGIDVEAGMPISWTILEGPPTSVIGFVVLWLLRDIADSADHQ
jgi:hypothetical protein